MLSLVLVPLWYYFYSTVPYLFPALMSIFYLLDWADPIINVLVGFPLRSAYKTKHKELENLPKITAAEQLRVVWLTVGIFYPAVVESQTYVMAIYAYCTAMMILLEYFKVNGVIQSRIKFWYYLVWTLLMGWHFLFLPFDGILALLLHGCNYVIDFRLLK